jgi:uncharacterized protein YbaR (Trm112 family)
MRFELYCPGCGVRAVDFESFGSAIMLAPNMALLSYQCPCCQTPLHVNVKLSRAQQEVLGSLAVDWADRYPHREADACQAAVSYSALQVVDVDSEFLQILVAPPTSTPEARSQLISFHEQLEQLSSVDEAIWRIDASRHGDQPPEAPGR